jgi:hypothetical protein
MKPRYSKLLIFESILPDMGGAVGLETVKFWTINKKTEGLIEADKKA